MPNSPNSSMTPGVVAARLSAREYEDNFSDLHPALDGHEALVASDRCYFCHDAPCVTACPTTIDIPLFIRQISTGATDAAAKTIFEQNILGGMCARVCPTETLCEEACVRETAEGKPVEIGRLQRFATDTLMAKGTHPFSRGAETGKHISVVGAGPAGLSAAHRLAMLGHSVTIYDARPKPGGLNEYGIAAYKTPNGFAQDEVDWLLSIGGITVRYGMALGRDLTVEGLRNECDAVFLGFGLPGVNALALPGAELANVTDAVDFIAALRQSEKGDVAVGRNVVVIGGGMTAVDAAVQSKLLGAETVTLVYRRGREAMNASGFEQDLAATSGVRIITNASPKSFSGSGAVETAEFAYTAGSNGSLTETGETFALQADQALVAIGQKLSGVPDALNHEGGKIAVDGDGRTNLTGIWAGGDCAWGGDDLTVTAVAEGRDAAMSIHQTLMGG